MLDRNFINVNLWLLTNVVVCVILLLINFFPANLSVLARCNVWLGSRGRIHSGLTSHSLAFIFGNANLAWIWRWFSELIVLIKNVQLRILNCLHACTSLLSRRWALLSCNYFALILRSLIFDNVFLRCWNMNRILSLSSSLILKWW